MKNFDRDALMRHISALTVSGAGAFVCSCAERVLEFYEAYSIEEGEGDVTALRAIVDSMWDMAMVRERPAAQLANAALDRLESALAEIMPNSERIYQSIFTTWAGDACNTVAYGLDVFRTGETSWAVHAATNTQSIVETYLATVNRPIFAVERLEDALEWSGRTYVDYPLLLLEVAKQERDLQLLQKTRFIDENLKRVLIEETSSRVSPVTRFRLDVRR